MFEIVKTASGYASTPTVLFSFDGTHGASPVAGLIADAAGDLFGTTSGGGANGSGVGTVFEITKNEPPIITGTVANQAVTDHATIDPFALVKITDPESHAMSGRLDATSARAPATPPLRQVPR